MYFSLPAVLLVALPAVLAQSLSDVPQCAITPALAAFGKTGCATTDTKCLCSATSLVPDLEAAIKAVCSADDVNKVNQFAISYCAKAGVTLSIPAAATGGSTSSTGSATTTGSTTTTSSSSSGSSTSSTGVAGAVSSAVSSGGSSSSSMAASMTSSLASAASTASSSASASAASATASKGAAAGLQVGGGSALFGALVAALAL